MELTTESVLALAPDDSSVKAARGLVAPGKWPTLGFDDAVVWGECKGSGAKPYQVEVELSGPTFKCSCPSRKFPCKHALALLLLRLAHEASFSRGEAPDWVKEWLDSRQKRAARQEEKKEKGQPADPAAAARREASRLRRMAAGLDDLERWMCDIVRHGLDQLENDSRWAEETAARMVDAQLPGIAARLRSLHGVTFSRAAGRPATGRKSCWLSSGSSSSSSTRSGASTPFLPPNNRTSAPPSGWPRTRIPCSLPANACGTSGWCSA